MSRRHRGPLAAKSVDLPGVGVSGRRGTCNQRRRTLDSHARIKPGLGVVVTGLAGGDWRELPRAGRRRFSWKVAATDSVILLPPGRRRGGWGGSGNRNGPARSTGPGTFSSWSAKGRPSPGGLALRTTPTNRARNGRPTGKGRSTRRHPRPIWAATIRATFDWARSAVGTATATKGGARRKVRARCIVLRPGVTRGAFGGQVGRTGTAGRSGRRGCKKRQRVYLPCTDRRNGGGRGGRRGQASRVNWGNESDLSPARRSSGGDAIWVLDTETTASSTGSIGQWVGVEPSGQVDVGVEAPTGFATPRLYGGGHRHRAAGLPATAVFGPRSA